nr:MAG TPA: hypothetical protein [Bacteriophage sp.]DAU46286.1 MAG TPA: hypothetical protein [Bacteriophage sp.]
MSLVHYRAAASAPLWSLKFKKRVFKNSLFVVP